MMDHASLSPASEGKSSSSAPLGPDLAPDLAQDWSLAELMIAAQWLMQTGADEIIMEEPFQGLSTGLNPPLALANPNPAPSRIYAEPSASVTVSQVSGNAPIPSREALEKEAWRLARACPDIESLRQALQNWSGCSLSKTAGHTICATTPLNPCVMVIAEAPTADDDQSGKALQGDSGALLLAMLASINISPEMIYPAFLSFWRPPGQRSLTQEELALCRPFLYRQMELVKPKTLLLLGQKPCQELLIGSPKRQGLRALGSWHQCETSWPNAEGITIWPAFGFLGLDYVLQTPPAKREAWAMLLQYDETRCNYD